MYVPIVGRWLTPDPNKFDAGDANLQRFVGNDPTNMTDPTGLAGEPVGHHSVPVAVLKKFWSWLTEGARDAGAGSNGGPTLSADGRGHDRRPMGGVQEPDYSKLVEEQLEEAMKANKRSPDNPMTKAEMAEFALNMRNGKL
jgi:uncharacterized protein RhaS with RHS repeats